MEPITFVRSGLHHLKTESVQLQDIEHDLGAA